MPAKALLVPPVRLYRIGASTLAVVALLAFTAPAHASAQERSIAGGDRVAILTERHGWLSGTFQDIRDGTVVLAQENSSYTLEVAYDSVLAWRVPASRIRRTLWHALLGGVVGGMVGVGVGFEGATKVTAPRAVQRESLRFGLAGVMGGLLLATRPGWRDVRVALATGAPGEQMLVMQETPGASAEGYPVGTPATSRTDRWIITRSELEAIQGATALDAIRRLRPQFLRARRAEVGRQALVLPVVYIDGTRLGGLSVLESIQLRTILEIEFYSPTEASMRWGLGHEGGVIHVTLRRA